MESYREPVTPGRDKYPIAWFVECMPL